MSLRFSHPGEGLCKISFGMAKRAGFIHLSTPHVIARGVPQAGKNWEKILEKAVRCILEGSCALQADFRSPTAF